MIETPALDTTVGRMQEGDLQAQVSLRGDVVVVHIENSETQRGFEISFSPDKADQFACMILSAVHLARGVGR